MLEAQCDFTDIRIRTGRNAVIAGRRAQFVTRCSTQNTDIIISIDSDCIFHEDAIRELTACFSSHASGRWVTG